LGKESGSMTNINNKKDILLLLLYSKGISDDCNEPIRGRTRLIKMLFLFLKEGLSNFKHGVEVSEENYYKFYPWFYGPFSQQIYDDINFFQLRGFIELKDIPTDNANVAYEELNYYSDLTGIAFEEENDKDEFWEQEIYLTQKGCHFASDLYNGLSENQKSFLWQFKKKFNSTPLKAILRYVYKTYPDSSTNSIIRDNIIGNDK